MDERKSFNASMPSLGPSSVTHYVVASVVVNVGAVVAVLDS